MMVEATATVDKATNQIGSNGTVSKLSRFDVTFMAVVTDSDTDDDSTRPQPNLQSHLKQKVGLR